MSSQVYANGTLIESWDDTTRTYTDHRTGESRPYTEEENAAANSKIESESRLDNLEARLSRLEAIVFPAPPDPETSDDPSVPDWGSLGGVWPNGGLLRDEGKVYRNISGVPLTTPPSGFPGDPNSWTHLFIAVLGTETPPSEGAEPWSAQASYQVGDIVEHNGKLWECLIAHGAEYQGTWAPGVAHNVWQELGPA